ncbi:MULTISPECIES: hypothetical protein [Photorhabdus]|uniref:Uncharacterized protein n=1 Tax=Photorhabdus khanii NC19 TaxID=1004151 RepID=W3V902_9GAMM|nr:MULTISPECIES: hypothetical protein [Photorhabdus]ETS31565.1 hypothetical protein PTE_02253 [Photorhabdus khanii NC19]
MKISHVTTGELSPSEYPMNAGNTFINRMKQDIGRITAHYRQWPVWMMCVSVGALFSTSVFAAATPNWNPSWAIKALGNPVINGKDNNGKPIRYPEVGTSTLLNVFPTVIDHNFPKPIGKEMMLKDGMFWVRAQYRLFKVPHVVTGKYTCKMVAKRKDRSPGKATVTLYTDAIVVNPDIYWFKGDKNVMESNVNDLTYTVNCLGTGFSWERKPEEKFELESKWENGVPSIEMQDTCNWIHNVAFWTPPDNNPNNRFKDPAIQRSTSTDSTGSANLAKPDPCDNPDNLSGVRRADSRNK